MYLLKLTHSESKKSEVNFKQFLTKQKENMQLDAKV